VLDLLETDGEQLVSGEGRNVYPRERGTDTECEDRLTYKDKDSATDFPSRSILYRR
jgi:hypothetical protein